MPTEIVKLELEEVSLVDRGDDPLAKVAIFKRSPEGVNMENEELEAKVEDTTEKGYKEDMKSDDMDEDDMEEMADEEGKKPARKSWKAEAQSFEEVNKMLLEEVETLKGRIAELETDVLEKAKPQEETIEVEGEMIVVSIKTRDKNRDGGIRRAITCEGHCQGRGREHILRCSCQFPRRHKRRANTFSISKDVPIRATLYLAFGDSKVVVLKVQLFPSGHHDTSIEFCRINLPLT